MNETINSVFTETTDGVNASINQLEVTCITSKQNKFHLDSEGNLSVNSITTVIDNPTSNINVDTIYPVGSIYMNTALVDPTTLFGGTWELLKNRFLIGAGDLYEVGAMAGEVEHKLTKEELPEHQHKQHGNKNVGNDSGVGYWNYITREGYCYGNDINLYENGSYGEKVGNDKPHNNMPPYLAVYMWKRVA